MRIVGGWLGIERGENYVDVDGLGQLFGIGGWVGLGIVQIILQGGHIGVLV